VSSPDAHPELAEFQADATFVDAALQLGYRPLGFYGFEFAIPLFTSFQ
jgi:hypothetical protein